MLKNWWKILFKEDIFDLIDPEKKPEYKTILDKIIYRLKAENYIISIKAWVYIVPTSDDLKLNEVDLIDKYYLKLLKKYITYNVWSDYFISWDKSLSIHMKDFSIVEKIFITTRNLNKKIKIANYEIIFKTISWKHDSKTINLYSKFSLFTETKNIDWLDFKVSNLELSLIESALLNNLNEGLNITLLTKAIKKYSKVFNREVFYEIWKYKYIMSFNRLKEISKTIDKWLYEVFLDVIKKNGALFIGEWLRGF